MTQERDLEPRSIYAEPDVWQAWERAAKENERSLSAEVRVLLRQNRPDKGKKRRTL